MTASCPIPSLYLLLVFGAIFNPCFVDILRWFSFPPLLLPFTGDAFFHLSPRSPFPFISLDFLPPPYLRLLSLSLSLCLSFLPFFGFRVSLPSVFFFSSLLRLSFFDLSFLFLPSGFFLLFLPTRLSFSLSLPSFYKFYFLHSFSYSSFSWANFILSFIFFFFLI